MRSAVSDMLFSAKSAGGVRAPNAPVRRAWCNPWLGCGVIFALVFACYAPALNGRLVWDDAAHVTRPELRSGEGLGRIWTDLSATQQYYPVLHSAFWVEHRLWGDATVGYHVTNLVLHALGACLLALGLRWWWTADRAGADAPEIPFGAEWLAAALFAVHPVGVESVAWISEQKNTLSLVFYLAAAWAYLKFTVGQRERTTRRSSLHSGGVEGRPLCRPAWWYGLATVLFLLALGTKSVTATLPAALLVLIWWRRGRWEWRREVVPLIPWFALGLAVGLFTAWVERTLIGAHGSAFAMTLTERVLLAGRLIWFYLGKLFWPADLMFIYPRWDVPALAMSWIGGLAAVVAVTGVLWALRRRWRGPMAAWLFYIGSLFPALGFFDVYPFRFSYAADHFQYLASVGVIVGVAVVVTGAIAVVKKSWGLIARVTVLGLIAGLTMLARQQASIYQDGETLYRATLSRNPDCWMAHNNLAAELALSAETLPAALEHYDEALRLNPTCAEAHNNLGNTLHAIAGRQEEAIRHFETAVEVEPRFVEAHLNLANALAALPGRFGDALPHYERALSLSPKWSAAHYSFGNALAAQPGRTADAIQQFETALRLQPDFAAAHVNLALLLEGDPGQFEAAAEHYRKAIALEPASARTHYNYAGLLELKPARLSEAADEYRGALRLDPRYAEAHNNLGILLARQGNFEQAREHWVQALELNPGLDDARRNLARLEAQRAVR